MSLTAEELEEKPVVFALAQQPHELNQDEFIATLWPLMCFSTGESTDASATGFPSAGYARWYRVPSGDWRHGDLVLGTVCRNDRGHGQPDKEWFQVYGEAGEHAGARVCELLDLENSVSQLSDLLRRPVKQHRIPRGDVYFRCTDAVAGPFRTVPGPGVKSNQLYFTPERHAEGDVDVYDLQAFNDSDITIVRSGARLSSNESMPTSGRSGIYQTQYQIFRKQDLDQASLDKQVKYFLTDELLVTKACKQIKHGKSWKKLRDELKPLVALLEEDPTGVSKAVVQGLPVLLKEAERRIAAVEPLVAAIIEDDSIEKKIEQKVQSVIQARADERAAEIEKQAVDAAGAKLAELKEIDIKIKSLGQQKVKLERDLTKLNEEQEQTRSRAEQLLKTVNERLQTGRDELITDLVLLAPLFQNNGAASLINCSPDASLSNGHVATEFSSGKTNAVTTQRQFILPDAPAPASLSLIESEFVAKRLWPLLGRHGASVTQRDAELFHATVLTSQLIGVPHPGWASGYAEAMGETARCVTMTASPKWLDFDSAFSGALAAQWRLAVNDPTRLHLIVLEGIDRCPTHAWLRPWLNLMAGWSSSLPDEQQTGWPSHVRLFITEEKSTACFDIPAELRQWILSFEPKGMEETIPEQIHGHFSMDNWRLGQVEPDETFDGYIRSLELPRNEPFTPYRMNLAVRLRTALMRLNPNDEFALDNLVACRLFACWNVKE